MPERLTIDQLVNQDTVFELLRTALPADHDSDMEQYGARLGELYYLNFTGGFGGGYGGKPIADAEILIPKCIAHLMDNDSRIATAVLKAHGLGRACGEAFKSELMKECGENGCVSQDWIYSHFQQQEQLLKNVAYFLLGDVGARRITHNIAANAFDELFA